MYASHALQALGAVLELCNAHPVSLAPIPPLLGASQVTCACPVVLALGAIPLARMAPMFVAIALLEQLNLWMAPTRPWLVLPAQLAPIPSKPLPAVCLADRARGAVRWVQLTPQRAQPALSVPWARAKA